MHDSRVYSHFHNFLRKWEKDDVPSWSAHLWDSDQSNSMFDNKDFMLIFMSQLILETSLWIEV